MLELCPNAMVLSSLGLALSDKQVPQGNENREEERELLEPLEPGIVRPSKVPSKVLSNAANDNGLAWFLHPK